LALSPLIQMNSMSSGLLSAGSAQPLSEQMAGVEGDMAIRSGRSWREQDTGKPSASELGFLA